MKRIITVLAVAAVWLLLGIVPAQAHSELVSSTPTADSVLDTPPQNVELVFNQKVQNTFVTVTVVGTDGQQWGNSTPVVAGERLTAGIEARIPPGVYTVGYRVVSEDGHPITGSYPFTVSAAPGPADAEPGPAEAAAATPASSAIGMTAPQTSNGAPMVLPILGGIVVLLFVGGIVLVLRGERRKKG